MEKTGLELLKEKINQANKNMILAVEDMKSARDKMIANQEILNQFYAFVVELQQAEIDSKRIGC